MDPDEMREKLAKEFQIVGLWVSIALILVLGLTMLLAD
jgi:hypothetical protein